MGSRIVLITVLSSFFLIGQAQEFTGQNYYLFPINPGQQNFLAGTMGELRASHFHAGLDIKTGGQIGLPVYAVADGYISRIKISTGGYGNALYIDHPNSTTSVYAHLDRYENIIEKYVLERQYAEESFEVDIFPKKNEIPVRRGELIAYSGNTGSSSGPHLHFEIRDSQQRILDPLLFGFSEIRDHISPIMKSIAFVTLNEKATVNGLFGRFTFDLSKQQGVYQTNAAIMLSGNIGIEVYGYDMMDGVSSRNGIMETYLIIDDDTIFGERKSRLAFDKQRNILVHTNYQASKNGSPRYNKLYVDNGNAGDFYTFPSKGYVFTDTVHQVTIITKDSYGNISKFSCEVNNRLPQTPKTELKNGDIFRNYMVFKSQGANDEGILYLKESRLPLIPYAITGNTKHYVWDLRNGLPDSILLNDELIKTNFLATAPAGTETHVHTETMDLTVYPYSLFDTLNLKYSYSEHHKHNWELFRFDHTDVPIKSSVEVTLKPKKTYDREKTSVYGVSGDRLSYIGGKWNANGISFKTTELSDFTLVKDSIPPFIQPVIVNQEKLYFKISDNLSGIKKYRATLNGQFLLMEYESKKNLIWAKPKDRNTPLTGQFTLTVTDNTGNQSVYSKTL